MTAEDRRPPISGATDSTDISQMNLWQKLAAITGEVGSIAKGGTNKEQGYAFIEYGAVAAALRTLFAKYHVVCIPNMGKRDTVELTSSYGKKGLATTIEFTFTFKNADKPDEVEQISWVGEASDYGDKGTNKAATAALKYCLMRTFNVSEKGDEDPDSTTIDRGKQEPEAAKPKVMTVQDAFAKISSQLKAKGFDTPDVRKQVMLKIAGVQDGADLTAPLLNHVMAVLETTPKADLHGYLDVENTEAPDVADEDAEQ